MGRNYYCEYCDKTFRDVLGVRKTHLKGALHLQNKKDHYDRFRDIKTLLQEESQREPCPRLLKNLDCNFGSRCRFSHYMPADLQTLEKAHNDALLKEQADREKKLKEFLDPERITSYWTYNERQLSHPESLPPSLRKWQSNTLNTKIPDWG